MTKIDIKPFLGNRSFQTSSIRVFVQDPYGHGIPGATVQIQDYDNVVAVGQTDSNGYYYSPDLPFPTEWYQMDFYLITVSHPLAPYTNSHNWIIYDTEIAIQLDVPGGAPSYYDITVVTGHGGTTNPAPGHYTGEGIITVTAVPYPGFEFVQWNMNGAFLTSSINFLTGDVGTFEAIFTAVVAPPPPLPPPSAASGKINAIRIQDVARQKWFNWDNGVWDANGTPYITPGANNLYIAFNARNDGGSGANLTLKITNSSGATLATKTEYTPAGGNVGIEWTGTMLSTPYAIGLSVTP